MTFDRLYMQYADLKWDDQMIRWGGGVFYILYCVFKTEKLI